MTSRQIDENLTISLALLQSQTIGLFRPYAAGANYFELVVGEDGDMLRTIHLGSLGGHSTNYVPANKGVYKKFPDGQTLSEFKSNPFGLKEFTDSFDKKETPILTVPNTHMKVINSDKYFPHEVKENQIAVGFDFSLMGDEPPAQIKFDGILYKRFGITQIPFDFASDFCSIRIYEKA